MRDLGGPQRGRPGLPDAAGIPELFAVGKSIAVRIRRAQRSGPRVAIGLESDAWAAAASLTCHRNPSEAGLPKAFRAPPPELDTWPTPGAPGTEAPATAITVRAPESTTRNERKAGGRPFGSSDWNNGYAYILLTKIQANAAKPNMVRRRSPGGTDFFSGFLYAVNLRGPVRTTQKRTPPPAALNQEQTTASDSSSRGTTAEEL
jgi:hypothetical protein